MPNPNTIQSLSLGAAAPELDTAAPVIDPALTLGDTGSSIKVYHETIESAQTAEKKFSDEFIDGCIDDSLTVGDEKVGIKGFLDKVETTAEDDKVIDDPDQIAGLYLSTTEMLARSLKIKVDKDMDPARKAEIRAAKDRFVDGLHDESLQAADGIVDWCAGKTKKYPVAAVEYHGLEVDGKDLLDTSSRDQVDHRANFTIQRQAAGTFIMAYSDKRVDERMSDQPTTEMTTRVYLNPDAKATPELFEKVLQAANEAGLSLQLKMFQRATEMADAHARKGRGQAADALRGDGIVIYTNDADANEVLSLALALAGDSPEAFAGRKTSKVPQAAAEGIAIGQEPRNAKGESLTQHRTQLFNYAARQVEKSGLTGEAARVLFRERLVAGALANGIDPNNIAFNSNSVTEATVQQERTRERVHMASPETANEHRLQRESVRQHSPSPTRSR